MASIYQTGMLILVILFMTPIILFVYAEFALAIGMGGDIKQQYKYLISSTILTIMMALYGTYKFVGIPSRPLSFDRVMREFPTILPVIIFMAPGIWCIIGTIWDITHNDTRFNTGTLLSITFSGLLTIILALYGAYQIVQ